MKVIILVMFFFISSLAFYQGNLKIELNCAPQCSNCSAQDICLACIETYYINASQCYPCDNGTSHCARCTMEKCTECLSNYFYLNQVGVCTSCTIDSYCLTCRAPNECFTCISNESYRNSSGPDVPGACIPCRNQSPLCEQCIGPLNCTKCITSEYYLKNGVCQICASQQNYCKECTSQFICTKCVSQYYFIESHLCLECYHFNTGCLTCNQKNGLNYCLSCKSNSFYYLTNSQRCDSCANPIPGCSTCTYNETSIIVTCTSCLQPDYIPVIGNNSCFKCANLQSCITCATPLQCITCINNWFPDDGTCVQCQIWISNCSQCVNNKTCSICKDTFYKNQADMCTSCKTIDTNCLTCSNGQKCDQCYDGYFSSDEQTKCLRCDEYMRNCISCSGHSNCITCSDNKLIVNGFCQDTDHTQTWVICVSVIGPVMLVSFIVSICCLSKKINKHKKQIKRLQNIIINNNGVSNSLMSNILSS